MLVLIVDGDGGLIRRRVTQRLGDDQARWQDDRNPVIIWLFFICQGVNDDLDDDDFLDNYEDILR